MLSLVRKDPKILNPEVPEVNENNYKEKALLVHGKALNVFLSAGKLHYKIEPIKSKDGSLSLVYWFPIAATEAAIVDYHKHDEEAEKFQYVYREEFGLSNLLHRLFVQLKSNKGSKDG
jgi:hypothetical protein